MSNYKTWDTFAAVWNYPLWKVGHDSVTVGHCVIAIFVVLVGLYVARYVKRRLRSRLEKKRNLDASGKIALERISFVLMISAVFYTALAILRIPLTVFHFAVGGLMIGFGFGARELFSNLISGIILMVERPVKIDDVVEVENEIGRVFNIGLRSFQIHTENNIDVMLPNSVVLNQKLVNWTKDDHMILTKVSIGIAYESDIQKATELMVGAAASIKGVLEEPAPFVLFKEHGASTLNFDIYFAVNVKNKMESWVLESQVNYALNDALRAAGVDIAFPQLDVHVKEDAKTDIEDRIYSEGAMKAAKPITGSPGPTWDQFKEAFAVFSNDYQIVGHPGEPTVSPFDEPREYGKYSLTQIPDLMTEKEFESRMGKMKKILIACMDKRVARKIWESENGASGEVFLVAIGGGVVQNRERRKALEVIAGYLAQFHQVREVVASDHEHVCGAVKYFLAEAGLSHENGLPGLLGKSPGSQEEREIMNRLIAHGAQPWVREFGNDKTVAKDAYVNESERDVQEFLIQIADIEPLSIEELENEMK